MRVNTESIPAAIELCVNDEWLNAALQIDANEPTPENFQILTNQTGLYLSWEQPLTNESIENYEIVCSSVIKPVNGFTNFSHILNGNSTTLFIPATALECMDYNCCIITHFHTERFAGLRSSTRLCETISSTGEFPTQPVLPCEVNNSTELILPTTYVATSLTSPTTSDPASDPAAVSASTPCASSQGSETILVPILGLLVGVLFLTLIVVSVALMAFMHSAKKEKAVKERSLKKMEMKM